MFIGLIPAILTAFLLAVVVALAVLGRRSSAFRPIVVPPPLAAGVRDARRAFARRLAITALVAGAVGIAAGIVGENLTSEYGRFLMLTPALMTLACTLTLAITPAVTIAEPGDRRSADLAPRRPWSFAPRWALAFPVLSGVLLLAVIGFLGATSSPQEDGAYRAFRLDLGDVESTTSPYPGWFYGVPLAVAAVAIAATALVALARIASAPRPTDSALREIDEVMRIVVTRVIAKVTTGTFVGYLGILLTVGGKVAGNAADQPVGVPSATADTVAGVAAVGLVVGPIAIVVGAVFVLLAVLDALRLSSATQPSALPRPAGVA